MSTTAPDIKVSWIVNAMCSVCEDGGNIESIGEYLLQCRDCGTQWNTAGERGEREES